ncbi:MAG: erg26, C-3 sterol dehydrogenase [Vezdaea aestivalis]|nr:MAG: erg26, C-3 sterol dehydrogenase [Vezdaea aestivalis]
MAPILSSVLITGGSGFLGTNIAQRLLTSPSTQIHLLDISPPPDSLASNPSITYHHGTITSLPSLHTLVQTIRPTAVFHTAGLVPSTARAISQNTWADYTRINITGTHNVLTASQHADVQVFVQSSSVEVINGAWQSHWHANEAVPYPRTMAGFYHGFKRAAEQLVLAANGEAGMRTCALRLAVLYGPGDRVLMPVLYQMSQSRIGRRLKLGKGENMFDFLEVENATHAHLLAAEHLLASIQPKGAGQAFHISDLQPVRFGDFADAAMARFGAPCDTGQWRVVLPVMLVWALLRVVELLGVLCGYQLTGIAQEAVEGTLERWYDCGEAESVLGYGPLRGVEEGVEKMGLGR